VVRNAWGLAETGIHALKALSPSEPLMSAGCLGNANESAIKDVRVLFKRSCNHIVLQVSIEKVACRTVRATQYQQSELCRLPLYKSCWALATIG
jgi:hypothetical protein